MSKYTTQVRFICETAAGLSKSVGFNDVNSVLDECWSNVFNFDFPIFDEKYRSVICKKILKHYYTWEIGEETVGLWKLRLDTRLNEIMPYYNQLYKSELLDFDPFLDTDITTMHTLDSTGNTESSATDSQNSKEKFSDTPQGSLSRVEDDSYLSSATITDNNRASETNATIRSTDEYIETIKGKRGSTLYTEMLTKLRETFLNIDMMIINDLDDLFFGLWN